MGETQGGAHGVHQTCLSPCSLAGNKVTWKRAHRPANTHPRTQIHEITHTKTCARRRGDHGYTGGRNARTRAFACGRAHTQTQTRRPPHTTFRQASGRTEHMGYARALAASCLVFRGVAHGGGGAHGIAWAYTPSSAIMASATCRACTADRAGFRGTRHDFVLAGCTRSPCLKGNSRGWEIGGHVWYKCDGGRWYAKGMGKAAVSGGQVWENRGMARQAQGTNHWQGSATMA